jgi:hypothetical protein
MYTFSSANCIHIFNSDLGQNGMCSAVCISTLVFLCQKGSENWSDNIEGISLALRKVLLQIFIGAASWLIRRGRASWKKSLPIFLLPKVNMAAPMDYVKHLWLFSRAGMLCAQLKKNAPRGHVALDKQRKMYSVMCGCWLPCCWFAS